MCVRVRWPGEPEQQRITERQVLQGSAQPGVVNVSSSLLTASRRYPQSSPELYDLWRQVHLVILLCSSVPELYVSIITTKALKKPLFVKTQTKAALGFMRNNIRIS